MDTILIPLVAIIFGCLIAIFGIIFSYLEKKKQYEAVSKLLESGKSLEDIKQIFDFKPKKSSDPYSYLKKRNYYSSHWNWHLCFWGSFKCRTPLRNWIIYNNSCYCFSGYILSFKG